jgi:1,4-dihydroxy-2-naphthoate octaprenyltransferase
VQPAMWLKALRVIPAVSRAEWRALDPVAHWLIATRAAVLVMTVMSALLAGIFALEQGVVRIGAWALLVLGLTLSHATNNLFNDYTDFRRGVDKNNYFRTQYGPQPLAHGLMTVRQSLTMAGVTGAIALACGTALAALDGWDPFVFILVAAGAVFVLFYTWPLKYIALGELSVLLVWGPLMIGGGFYALARAWDWSVVARGLPYAFGVTTVLLGKHVDKLEDDRRRGIFTLPVLIGERASRYAIIGLMFLGYILVGVLIALRAFTPALAIVLLGLPSLRQVLPPLLHPRPAKRPAWFPNGQGGWPLFFAPLSFVHNRAFGLWFLVGLLGDLALRLAAPGFWR